jgi:hypothetical protein
LPQQSKPPKPSFSSFLIADTVIQEKVTEKWSVIGIFDRIHTNHFPFNFPKLGLFICITDAAGKYKIRVEFLDDNDNKLAQFEEIQLEVTDRLSSVGFGIQTRNLPIPKPGKYNFDLYFNDDYIKSLPLNVEQRQS